MYSTISTNRLNIRAIRRTDAPFMFKLMNTPGWLEFIGDREIKNPALAEAYIQKMLDQPEYFYHIIEENERSIPIGVLSFMHRKDEHHPDLGFALLPEHSGYGFAFEASQEFLSRLRKSGRIKEIIALTKPNNASSINLLEKLGFELLNNQGSQKENLTYYYCII